MCCLNKIINIVLGLIFICIGLAIGLFVFFLVTYPTLKKIDKWIDDNCLISDVTDPNSNYSSNCDCYSMCFNLDFKNGNIQHYYCKLMDNSEAQSWYSKNGKHTDCSYDKTKIDALTDDDIELFHKHYEESTIYRDSIIGMSIGSGFFIILGFIFLIRGCCLCC